MYETVKHAGRTRSRWIPDGATKVTEKHGLGVAYVYHNAAGVLLAIAYVGNAAKPAFHYRYKRREDAAKRIAELFEGLAQHQERVKQYRKEANSGHTLKVGDIITNSWGYDQTNVDWYRIVKTSDTFVWLQPISAHVEETGFMSGSSAPHVDTADADPAKWGFQDASGKIERHKAQGAHVTMKFGSGSKWDGRPMYASWYA